jgi:phage I-like protein
LLVSYEHRALGDYFGDTSAAGWIDQLEVRDTGLWGHVRWTAKGKADIAGGNYRLLSPEFTDFEDLGSNRLRPRKLYGASLTNKPNLNLTPVANKDVAANQTTTMDYKTLLIGLLGLAADATDDAITAASTAATEKLKEVGATSTSAAADAVTAANKQIIDMRGELADAELARRNITSANKAYAPLRDAIMANKDTGCLLADAVGTAGPGGKYVTIAANKTAATPLTKLDAATAANKQEAAVQAYISANKCTYRQAFDIVSRTMPELFSVG